MDGESEALHRRGWARRIGASRWARRALWLGFVVTAVLWIAPPLGHQVSDVGPGRAEIGFAPSASGRTTIAIPPLGQASADTHLGPVQVRVELRSIDVSKIVSSQGRVDTGGVADQVRHDLPDAVRAAVIRLLVVAVVVGAIAAAVLPRRRRSSVVAGALIGGVTCSLLMASALPGFDATAFDRLTFEGSLSSSEQVLAALSRGGAVGRRLGALSDRVANLYSSVLTGDLASEDAETVILHISDLHLNPIGVELARRLAASFHVDAVLDTGDTTSFGSPLEGPFTQLLSGFGVPYLYVGGNHDSPAIRRTISAVPGVTAIDRRVVTVGGVSILGFDDPLVTTTRHVDGDERVRIEHEGAAALGSLLDVQHPDLVAVHNPLVLRDAVGKVRAAAAGHVHRAAIGARDGTVVSVCGSTGATGLGSLLTDSELPYAASLLRFRDHDLVAVDQIEVVGTSGDLVITRHTVSDESRRRDDADFIDADVEEGVGSAVTSTTPQNTTTSSVTTTSSTATSSTTSR